MIICGFPCIGKSTWAKNCDNVIDLDSSTYSKLKNKNWTWVYVDEAISLSKRGKIVLVSTHVEVRERMAVAGQKYTVVYPAFDQKEEYVKRASMRDNHPLKPSVLEEHWGFFWTSINEDVFSNKIMLQPGEYICDVTGKISQLLGVGEPSAVCCGDKDRLGRFLDRVDSDSYLNKQVYIGCPYTSDSKLVTEDRANKVSACAAMLIELGYNVVSPVAYGHALARYVNFSDEWEKWMSISRTMMRPCGHMITLKLDGWRGSRGLAEEINTAHSRDMGYVEVTYEEILSLFNERKLRNGF